FGWRVFGEVEEFEFAFDGAEGRETTAMDGAGAKGVDGGQMLGSWIAFVLGETVARILLLVIAHQAIAGDFCEDAGGGNGIALAVALHKRRLSICQPFDAQAIYENVLRFGDELIKGGLHAAPCGLADVYAV